MKKVSSITKSTWIDELSEEEEKVLKRSAEMDNEIKKNKKLNVGLLDY